MDAFGTADFGVILLLYRDNAFCGFASPHKQILWLLQGHNNRNNEDNLSFKRDCNARSSITVLDNLKLIVTPTVVLYLVAT